MAVIGSTAWRQEQNARKDRANGGGVTNVSQTAGTSGGASPGSTAWKQEQNAGGQKNTSTPSGGYTTKYTGGNASLDNSLKQYSDAYSSARANGDWRGMQSANEKANQLRNQYGYAAESAYDDISKIRAQNGGGTDFTQGGVKPSYQQSTQLAPGVNDYSYLIEEANQAAKKIALAEIEAARDKNLAEINRARQGISPAYTAARNQAAGSAELAKRQFNEYAAANGLNSGAGGQAQLAMNNALQANLSNLNTREASSLADLELQRSQAEIDYNNAIAKAEADGNYTLAQQLYAEKVRADEALRAQMQWQAEQDFENARFQWQKEQADISNQKDDTANLYQMLMKYAEDTGNYSLLSQFGFTPDQIAQWEARWQKKQEYQDQMDSLSLQSQYSKLRTSSGGSGRRSSGGGSGGKSLTYAQAKELAEEGHFSGPVLSVLRAYGFSDQDLKDMYGYGDGGPDEITGYSQLGPTAKGIANGMSRVNSGSLSGAIGKQIRSALDAGSITQAEADYLMSMMGF